MIIERQASAIIILSIAAGLFLSPAVDDQKIFKGIADQLSTYKKEKDSTQKNSEFVYGTAHEHAIFHIVVNDSEKDLTAQRFQLQSEYSHLENNNSDIVHKHAEGVKWKDFLDTINTSVDRGEKLCLDIYNQEICGKGKIVLNNNTELNLSKEISQGDNLLIVIGKGDLSEVIQSYMAEELPPDYETPKYRGKQI